MTEPAEPGQKPFRFYRTFGEMLDDLAAAKGFHQHSQLARVINPKASETLEKNVGNWRRGRNLPSPSFLPKLAIALGVTDDPELEMLWNRLYAEADTARRRLSKQALIEPADEQKAVSEVPLREGLEPLRTTSRRRSHAIIALAATALGVVLIAGTWHLGWWRPPKKVAPQTQPDGTMILGGIRLNPKAPPPAEQRAACGSTQFAALGQLAMSFLNVEPWVSNHPLLERNCSTLLDIPPVSHGPFIKDMLSAEHSWWSRVTRVNIPQNKYDWREGLGFAWCDDKSCRRNILYVFDSNRLIGVCHSTPTGEGVTRYVFSSPGGNEVWSYTKKYTSCVENPQSTIQAITAAPDAADRERLLLPSTRAPRGIPPGISEFQGIIEYLQRYSKEGSSLSAIYRASREDATQAWEKLKHANSVGW